MVRDHSPDGNNRTTVITHTLDLSRWKHSENWLKVCEVSLWGLPIEVVASAPSEKLGTVAQLRLDADFSTDDTFAILMALEQQATLLGLVIAIALHPGPTPHRYLPDARFLLRDTYGQLDLNAGKTLAYSSLAGALPERRSLSLYCVVMDCPNKIPLRRRPPGLNDYEAAICRSCYSTYKRGKQVWHGGLLRGIPGS